MGHVLWFFICHTPLECLKVCLQRDEKESTWILICGAGSPSSVTPGPVGVVVVNCEGEDRKIVSSHPVHPKHGRRSRRSRENRWKYRHRIVAPIRLIPSSPMARLSANHFSSRHTRLLVAVLLLSKHGVTNAQQRVSTAGQSNASAIVTGNATHTGNATTPASNKVSATGEWWSKRHCNARSMTIDICSTCSERDLVQSYAHNLSNRHFPHHRRSAGYRSSTISREWQWWRKHGTRT